MSEGSIQALWTQPHEDGCGWSRGRPCDCGQPRAETKYQRVAREQRERNEAREAAAKAARRKAIPGDRDRSGAGQRNRRNADRIDGYDRDDMGESPDY